MRIWAFTDRYSPYKDRIYDSALIRENASQWKPVFLHISCSADGLNARILEYRKRTEIENQIRSMLSLYPRLLATLTTPVNRIESARKVILTPHERWRFPLKVSSVNVTKSAVSCRFGNIYWGILSEKLYFLCSVSIKYNK